MPKRLSPVSLEQQLREAEERGRLTVEARLEAQNSLLLAVVNSPSDIIIFSLDTEYRYLVFNNKHRQEMKAIWGCDIDIGMSLLGCMTDSRLRELAKRSIDRALGGESFSETQHQPDADIHYEFSWNPIRLDGKVTGATVFVRDVSGRMRAEKALQKSEEQLNLVLRGSNDGWWDWDIGSNTVYYSERWWSMLGMRPGEVPANAALWQRLMHPEDAPRVDKFFNEELASERVSYEVEVRFWHTGGHYVPVLSRGFILRDLQGKPIRVSGANTDLSEIHRQRRELQEKNDELMRFAFTVSHDLKSPLVTIRTFLGYLTDDIKKSDADRVKSDLGFINAAAEKMSQMLTDLLNLARVGLKSDTFAAVSLQDAVADALTGVAGLIAETRANVVVTDSSIMLFGDRGRLVEIFQNLLENALKFRSEHTPRIEIGAAPSGGDILVWVRDNGIGIDPRHQAKLFGLFEKLDPRSEGTGIGLALVRRVVEVHGGKTWIDSAGPGQGTTVRFSLPKKTGS